MFKTINGARLFLDTQGTGDPVLICLHGSYVDHSYLKYSLSGLEDRHQLVYVDFRGSGRSTRDSPQLWHTAQLADDVLTVLDSLGLDRVFLLAHSWGCHVAVKASLASPERVAGNVLLNPGIFDFPSFYRNLARVSGARAVQLAQGIFERRDWEGFAEYLGLILPHLFQVPPDPGFLENAIVSEEFFFNSIDELRTTDLFADIFKLQVPTVVCNGQHDFYTSPSLSDDMKAKVANPSLSHIRVESFENSGHFVMNDERDRLHDLIVSFVASDEKPRTRAVR